MTLDPLLLSRIQFAFTIGYHIVFPTLTMGLALYMVYLEFRWLRTRDKLYRRAIAFWVKFFALTFGMGVVTGVVLSYEIGTNWGPWAKATGNVLGPLMSFEVLTAFFLEAGFLGIMLFGRRRVSEKSYCFATLMVFLGTMLSAFWILAANSWMQTPAGFRYEDGVFYVTSWMEAVFNPSMPYRLAHMLCASFLTTTFVVIAVNAWYLRRGRHVDFARRSLRRALYTAALLAPLQIFLGDLHGLNTFEHQPIKVAAMEAHWETETGAPLYLFAWPDMETESNDYAIAIPKLGSLILTHSLDGKVIGLKSVPPENRPYVPLVFFSFRVMIAMGVLMLALAWWGAWQGKHRRLRQSRTLLWFLSCSGPLGFIAVIAGWITTEAGRQPWTVYGLLRTSESVSAVSGPEVALSLSLFGVVYAVLMAAYLWFFLKLVRHGPPEASV